MKKLIPILLITAFLLSSCRNSFNEELSSSPDFPAVVASLKIEKAPEKVAVLSDGISNVIDSLGLSDKIVAAETSKEGEELIKIGDEYHPDADKIIESGAEFLLTFTEVEYSVMNKLSDAGVRVIVLKKPATAEEISSIYTEMATLFFGENEGKAKGESVFSGYRTVLDNLKKNFVGKSFIYLKNRDLSPSTDNAAEGILEYVFGSENLTEAVNEDALETLNPDYIFLDSGVDKNFISSLSIAEKLTAVTENNIVSLPSESFLELTPDSLNTLSELIKTE